MIDGGFPKLRVPTWGPITRTNSSNYGILGSTLGSLYFGKLPDFLTISSMVVSIFVSIPPKWPDATPKRGIILILHPSGNSWIILVI